MHYFYGEIQIKPMNILLVEDEPKVAAFIQKGLQENSYTVTLAYDGFYGSKLAMENPYDLVILDVILPVQSGLEVCKNIRSHNQHVPILMLTALGTTDDKVLGLDSGADDYLVKPFQFSELLARTRALLRRNESSPSKKHEPRILQFTDVVLDLEGKTVTRAEIPIKLTAREFKLLEFLMKNTGKVLDRATIAENVWDINFDTGTNMIDVYVNYLRNKLDKPFPDKLIHTVVGMGYVMRLQK